ncbi:GAF domain-containing protein [Virgisporangium aurantiacum]|uniref:histidine kinase n=1 Tax=Virgisporangium aurantiacum TaxID=175570 RepID=A0A8J4DY74_9ACTN|nr:GAF domain-containing protein [Virgisporangium aurantiacum]GIJ54341.1 hypothetical protein Vau01_018570 [Virgisporangium aurantiacum]
MARLPMTPSAARWLSGLVAGVAMGGGVTVVIAVLQPELPSLSLLVLYMLAVLPVAVRWGAGPAAVVAVLSTVVFGFVFLPPRNVWWVAERRNIVALGVFVLTAVVVGNLAARLRRAARESARLTEEQAALRRVATLVAQTAPSSTVFEAVTREVGTLCGADLARMECYGEDGSVTGVGAWSRVPVQLAVGTRFALDGVSIARQVRQTRGPVRVDSFVDATGAIAVEAHELGIRSSVGCPIMVDGHLWGVIAASSKSENSFPTGTESQITEFTELVATAIANAQSRAEITQLLEEQAALRRVATQVAREVPPAEVFATVVEEIHRLVTADVTVVVRSGRDSGSGMVTIMAQAGENPDRVSVGGRWTLDPELALAEVLETGRPARRDDYDGLQGRFAEVIRQTGIRSSVAVPVIVGGRIWGALGVGTRGERFPADVEQHMAAFIDLIITAVTNAQARAELRRMADEQSALRRVATLAARGAPPERVFSVVADEIGELVRADLTAIARFEADGTTTYMGGRGWLDTDPHKDLVRWKPEPPSSVALVRQTGRSARLDLSEPSAGDGARLSDIAHREKIVSTVAGPIVVGARLWGAITVGSRSGPLPADTEQRMVDFTEIVAIAIANTESRTELAASRARVIAAGDAARRRFERDLHDGAQQRLVSLALELRHAQGAVPGDLPQLRADLGRVAHDVTGALDELRELSRGIHPAILSEGGLGPALRTLARRAGLPVEVDVRARARFQEPLEVAAYYVVSEAITNTTKHAAASYVEVVVEERDHGLWLSVRDDGSGGADARRGSGLTGLRDRVEALGGSIDVSSPPGEGTLIEVSLPRRAV